MRLNHDERTDVVLCHALGDLLHRFFRVRGHHNTCTGFPNSHDPSLLANVRTRYEALLALAAAIPLRQDVCHSMQERTAAPVLYSTQARQAESGLHRGVEARNTLSI